MKAWHDAVAAGGLFAGCRRLRGSRGDGVAWLEDWLHPPGDGVPRRYSDDEGEQTAEEVVEIQPCEMPDDTTGHHGGRDRVVAVDAFWCVLSLELPRSSAEGPPALTEAPLSSLGEGSPAGR